jgi:20S proteasome alpha/beta subunit
MAKDNQSIMAKHTTQADTIDAGATLELTGADSGSITFSGSTGTLVLDNSTLFTGELINLTGDGNLSSSDQIDLKDIAFVPGTTESYAGNSSGGVLTVTDAQNHTANISLAGNYTNSTFTLSSDGHGGTTVVDPPVTPFALGVDVGNPNADSPSEEAAFEANFNAFSALMGAKPQYLDQFGNQSDPISQWVGQATWNAASVAQSPVLKNVTPVIGLPMSSTAPGSGTADQFYQAFAAGTYDSVLQGMVKAWANSGFTSQIWRPGWEMNVSSMPSYVGNDAATQADWVKAFQHISTVLHAAGQADGVNVQIMWNANVQNYSDAGNVVQTAYPGNQYVDIIGADIYGDVHPYGSLTQLYDWDKSGQVLNSPNPVYDTSVKQWAADPINLLHYYTYPASNQWSLDGSAGHATTLQDLIDLAKSSGKPLAIAETGAGNTADGAGLADNPTFVQWLSQTLQQSGVPVSFVNIWDSNSGGNYEFSNAADGKPLEAAAWANYFGAGAVLAPTLASFSPDSAVVGDGITNVNHLTLTGTAVAGSTVEVFDGTTEIGTTTANGSGAWTFATATLADGTHAFTSEAMDAAGNVSAASAALNVTVDTIAPNAPNIISDTPSATALLVTGTAEAGSTVKLYEGATLLGTGQASTSGTWNINTGSLSPGTHNFTATATDAAGNVSVLSAALDIVTGPTLTVIETSGSTSLSEVGTNFFFSANGTGPELKYGGAPYVAGQFVAWVPLGAEATSSGYDVAWKNTTTGLYTVWSTDSDGNFTSNLLSNVSGTSGALESIETTFHQDLNGDGVIGVVPTTIEASGSTSLVQVGSNYFLDPLAGGTGLTVKYGGVPFVAGQFGAWVPLGAEATSSGYDVAWKNTTTGLYTVWSLDSNGNFTSNLLSNVSGTSVALESMENTLHQDLNGDGIIDTPATVIEATGNFQVTLSHMTQAATIDAGATLELTGADSGSITFGGATGTLVLDHSSSFTGKLINLTGNGNPSSSDQIDLKDIAFGSGTTYSYAGNTSGGILTISDAQNHTANISLVGNYTNSTFTLSSDGHGGTIAIDPPKDNFAFASNPAPANAPTTPSVTVGGAGNDGFVFHHPAGSSGSQNGFAHDGPALNVENSHLLALANETQSEHQLMDAGHDVGVSHSTSPTVTHFAEFNAGHFMIH